MKRALLLFALCSCAAAKDARPAVCHGVPRAKLTAIYLAEVAALNGSGVCVGYADPNACPEYAALNAEQAKRRQTWVECSP
jgi:hypothetical protein